MKYRYLKCKTALNKPHGHFHYYDLNIYRGCFHACPYCYAIYSHQFLGENDFFETIYIKENIAEKLEEQLKAKSWKKEVINIGSVCDSYQPIEKEKKIMRDVLKLMIKYENPIIISTKSTLILRDIDLLEELSKITYVSIALTITSCSDDLNNLIEPRAPKYLERFKTLKILKQQTHAQIGLHMMPLIPYLSTDKRSIEMMFKLANQVKVDYVIIALVNLRGNTRKNFFNFLQAKLPEYYQPIYNFFSNPEFRKEFNKEFYPMLNNLIAEYQINLDYQRPLSKQQLSLFSFENE